MPLNSLIIYKGELRTSAEHLHSGTVILTDAPLDNQGLAQSFSPTDLVATALGACMLTMMGIKARENDWDIDGTRVAVEKIMTDNPRRIEEIVVGLYFPTFNDEKGRTILENTARTCPVAKSVHPDILQKITFNWNAL